jgi:hypothetical protein
VPKAGKVLGDVLVQPQQRVVDDVRVRVLLDRDRGGGVRAVNDTSSVLDVFILNNPTHILGNLNKFRSFGCPNFESSHVNLLRVGGILMVSSPTA